MKYIPKYRNKEGKLIKINGSIDYLTEEKRLLELDNTEVKETFLDKLKRFENWFNIRFGWFFTNGNK